MAFIAAILQKFKHFLSNTIVPSENGFISMLSSLYSPSLHILTVILALVLIYILFTQPRSSKTTFVNSSPKSTASNNESTSVHDLAWLNKILSWAFVTAPQGLPPVVDTWIQDINIALAKQKNKFGVLVYGLREGSAPPWIKQVEDLKRKNNELVGKVLLETSEMGFLITVQETLGSKVFSSSYSAIFVQFQCWFAVKFVRHHGNVVVQLSAAEKSPILHIKMKPLTKQTLVSTVPETIAEALKDVILSSVFFLNVSTWEPLSQNMSSAHEEEESCYGDSDDETTYKDVNEPPNTPRMVGRSLSDGLVLDGPTVINRNKKSFEHMAASVPGSRANTPSKESLRNLSMASRGLSGSLGSLSSITRTPSGRGPAKPIRVREKQLHVKVLKVSDILGSETCNLHLDSPTQHKTAKLNDGKLDDRVVFDLSSRSSQLEIQIMPKSATPSKTNVEPLAKAIISVDAIDMEKCNKFVAPLHNSTSEEPVGSVQLEFVVMENPRSTPMKRYSFSTTDQKLLNHVNQALQNNEILQKPAFLEDNKQRTSPSHSGTKVTKVTSTTVKSLKDDSNSSSESGSPVKKVTGVSYIQDSVAASALRDLSNSPKHNLNVKKTSILIKSVVKDPNEMIDHAQALTVIEPVEQNETNHKEDLTFAESASSETEHNGDFAANSSPEKVNVEIHPVESSPALMQSGSSTLESDVKLRTKVGQVQQEVKVRRTKSLIFNSHKKQKQQQRNSLAMDDSQASLSPTINQLRSKKKSGSMTKLFSRMTRSGKKKSNGIKELESADDSITELVEQPGKDQSILEDTPAQNGNHSPDSTKLKRSKSLRGLLRGKRSPKKS